MKKLIIANWKCNPTNQKEAKQLLAVLNRKLPRAKKAKVVICPPFCYLPFFSRKISFVLGAQDCFWQEKGAFTGQVSPLQLKDLNVKYILLGHSEKRALGETDSQINLKLRAVLKTGLKPVLFLGEKKEEREKEETFKVINQQFKRAIKSIAKSKLKELVIAYEPVWAVGAGRPCSVDDAVTASLFLRKLISKIADKKTSRQVKILYGGSVNSENAADYLASNWLDGLLAGGASLNIKEFLKIIQN